VDRVLSQQEIDNAFRATREAADDPAAKAEIYDFRRTDRIAKDQLRTIYLLHENFARSMSSSLSAYLRQYAVVNLISVEQLSFKEFVQTLPSPTSLVVMGLKPYDGNGVLEINPSLVFPILEMMLGGTGKSSGGINREITEIERSILDGFMRVILNDLRTAWTSVANIGFSIESHEAEPQLLQFLAQNEAVVAISIELRIGETSGLMNLGIPSIIVKMLRQKLDQHRTVRRIESTDEDHMRLLRLVRPALVHIDARLQGQTLGVPELLNLTEGDVLCFEFPETRPLEVSVNGKVKYQGSIVASGGKRSIQVRAPVTGD
jgi:flagellar motor switch protein FliM